MDARRLQATLILTWAWAFLGSGCRAPVSPLAVEEIVPGRLLVELGRGAALPLLDPKSPLQTAALPGGAEPDETFVVGGLTLRLLRPILPDPDNPIYLFGLPGVTDETATRDALQKVAADPRVHRAEPDRVRRATAIPNDLFFPQQWNLQLIRAPSAWDIGEGSQSVVVAVLDTGIVPGHPDLDSRLVPGYDFVSSPESAQDSDPGRDPDPTDTGSVETSRLHGTHVAGIIGALTDNALGIAGVDRHCRLMPVRVLGVQGGDGVDSDIADAVRWASGLPVGKLPPPERPADVLNLSFGGPSVSFTLQRAIDEAIAKGVLVVAAAGNGAVDTLNYSPGGLDGVVSVGAVGSSGLRAAYSNYGQRVDLLAPGGGEGELTDAGLPDGILSTYRDTGPQDPVAVGVYTYYPLTGTSQAAPHVAGVAAMARALWPDLRQAALSALLRQSANRAYRCDHDPLGGCGAGLLDAEAMLRLARQQKSCGCGGGQICLDEGDGDGGPCVEPPMPHPLMFVQNGIHGGFCSYSMRGGSPAGGMGLIALGLGTVTLLLTRRRHRFRSEQV